MPVLVRHIFIFCFFFGRADSFGLIGAEESTHTLDLDPARGPRSMAHGQKLRFRCAPMCAQGFLLCVTNVFHLIVCACPHVCVCVCACEFVAVSTNCPAPASVYLTQSAIVINFGRCVRAPICLLNSQ